MKQIPLTSAERMVIEEAFMPYMQAVTIVAKLRGLNPAVTQISGDRQFFVVADDVETHGVEGFNGNPARIPG